MSERQSPKRTIRQALELALQARTSASYCAQSPHPVFVFGTFNSMHDPEFFTLDGEGQGVNLSVLDVCKRPGANVFGDMITVGRASNNDVSLRQSSVSKFHAYLKRLGGALVLVDAKSTYGTRVNGVELEAETPTPLGSGDVVQFGRLQLTFYEPAAFYEVLHSALEAQPPAD